MSTTVRWTADPVSAGVTDYDVEKSTDKAVTWVQLANVVYNPVASNSQYDKANQEFVYADSSGVPGDIYRVRANGILGASGWAYVVAPMSKPPMCLVIGYMLTAFSEADTEAVVCVRSFVAKDKKWALNPPGLVAQNPEALGLQEWSKTVRPDADGMWQIQLMQGSYALIEIASLNFVLAFEVPARSGPINCRDIPQLRGSDYFSLFAEQTGTPAPFVQG